MAVKSGNNDSNYAFTQNEANKMQEIKVTGNANTYADSGKLYVENGTDVDIDNNSEIMQALQSLASKSGRNIILTNNIESGANGKYTDGKIYVRADVDSRYYLSLSLHEAGHFVKANNPLEFKALSDFVFNYLTKHGRNVDFLLDDLRSKYAGKYISEEELKEELVCNSLMAIATDEKATAYVVGSKGTIEKIVSAIKKICAKIKDFLMNGTTNYTAKAFANDIDALQELAQNLSTSIDNAKANAQSAEKFEGGSEVKVDEQRKSTRPDIDRKDVVVADKVITKFSLDDTAEVFQKVGFNALPVTINKTHIEYALHGTKDADHYLGETKLKQLPEKLKNPVAIIKSETKSNNRVVALLDFSQNGKTVIVPVEIDGIGKKKKK